MIAALLTGNAALAEVPEKCIQAPSRVAACPHMLYRVAKADVPALSIPKGGMICLCLTDLTDLPQPEQPTAFKQIADEYRLTPLALFTLLEQPAPDWAKNTF